MLKLIILAAVMAALVLEMKLAAASDGDFSEDQVIILPEIKLDLTIYQQNEEANEAEGSQNEDN